MSTTIPDPLDCAPRLTPWITAAIPDPEVLERARGPRRYSAKYRGKLLALLDGLATDGAPTDRGETR